MSNPVIGTTLLLGSSGFLGSYFARTLRNSSKVHTTEIWPPNNQPASSETPIRFETERDLLNYLETLEFKHLINCVALADIERCQKEPELATWMNVGLPKTAAKYCKTIGATMTHISTDAVFDGLSSFNHENDKPNPISEYGISKLEGEMQVLDNLPTALIARVNFFGRAKRKTSLFDFFYSAMKAGLEVPAYSNVFFTPLYAADTVRIILKLNEISAEGIVHVVGSERISKYDFALKIASEFGLDSKLISKQEAPLEKMANLRGFDLSLASNRLQELGILPTSIDHGITELKNEMERF